MTTIRLIIPGTPVPKGRPRKGKGHFYTPQKTVAFEAAAKMYARREMKGEQPYDCPMEVRIQFVFEPPAYFAKQRKSKLQAALDGKIDCVNRSDIDNIAKAVLDSANQVIYLDDKQIVKLTATKVYGPKAMTIADFVPRIRSQQEAA